MEKNSNCIELPVCINLFSEELKLFLEAKLKMLL